LSSFDPSQCGIPGDVEKPGSARGVTPKLARCFEGQKKGLLQQVFRVFAVSGETTCVPEDSSLVARDECGERRAVSRRSELE